MLIDAHIHLQNHPGFRSDLLNQAKEYCVGQFFCNAIKPEEWGMVQLIANTDARVVPFFGVHPWNAEKVQIGWDQALEKCLTRQPSGIGEIGLDKYRAGHTYEKQVAVFCRQLEMAVRLSKPVSIHCVQAWGDLLEMLRKDLPSASRFLLHSYHGSLEMLREFLKLGAYISFSWKSFQRLGTEMRDLVKEVPLDRLFLETDFPYLEPQRPGAEIHMDKYKQCLHEAYAFAAHAKDMKEHELEEKVWANGTAFLH